MDILDLPPACPGTLPAVSFALNWDMTKAPRSPAESANIREPHE